MDWLRVSLLIFGVILIAGIYVVHRLRSRDRLGARAREMDDWGDDGGVHIRAHRDDHEVEPVLGETGNELESLLESEQDQAPKVGSEPGRMVDGSPERTPRGQREPERVTSAAGTSRAEAVASTGEGTGSVLENLKERFGLRGARGGSAPAHSAVTDTRSSQPRGEAHAAPATHFDDVSEPRVVGRNPLHPSSRKEKILVLHVVAPRNRPFTGVSLGAALKRAGLELGEMSIYHYRDAGAEAAEPLFSVANMVAPGTLTDDDIAGMMTPGITLFLQLHLCDEPHRAFQTLLETSHVLARDLGGRIMDAQHSTATNQTLAHMREDMNQWLLRQRPELLRRKAEK